MPTFDITAALRPTCEDIVSRRPEFSHIDMDRVALGFCQARKDVKHGLQASLTPLRFEKGRDTKRMRGRTYACQKLVDGTGRDYLYLLNVYVPRFLNGSLEEKLTTLFHELWHISPASDGDVRRHPGRCYVHGPSEKEFDAHARSLAKRWLAAKPPKSLYAWLEYDFASLQAHYGRLCGQRFPAPKLRVIDAA